MKRAALTIVLALGVALAVTACEPPATITRSIPTSRPYCGQSVAIDGKVTPIVATSKVVLQIKRGGKWSDWSWYSGQVYPLPPKRVLSSPVNVETGEYRIAYEVPTTTDTIALRVRSNSGESVSSAFYITPRSFEDSCTGSPYY